MLSTLRQDIILSPDGESAAEISLFDVPGPQSMSPSSAVVGAQSSRRESTVDSINSI